MALLTYCYSRFYFISKDDQYLNDYNPTNITNYNNPPIILVHGSNSNQREFDLGVKILNNNPNIGHVFTVQLNKKPFKNDEGASIQYYSNILFEFIKKIKFMYNKSNDEKFKIILIGHSMGGLISGYFENYLSNKINIEANVISICTPWQGTYLANIKSKFVNIPLLEQFTIGNKDIKNLYNDVKNKNNYYSVGTYLDLLVGHWSTIINNKNHKTYYIHNHVSLVAFQYFWHDIINSWILKIK